jgi:hypothetical protein
LKKQKKYELDLKYKIKNHKNFDKKVKKNKKLKENEPN